MCHPQPEKDSTPMPDKFDVIVIGSGAGGGAAAYKLVKAGKRVLMLEKGHRLPLDATTLSTTIVFKEGRFFNKTEWQDGRGRPFTPTGEHYNLGGKTKWYGAALLRFTAHEFEADPPFKCLGWPFGLAELEPYYAEAERMLHVNHFPNEPELQSVIDRILASDPNWRMEPLPLGLKPEIVNDPQEAKHFDGYASVAGYKGDSEEDFIKPIEDAPNFRLLLDKEVTGFLHAGDRPEVIEGVICADGGYYRADTVVLSCGAMSSPRLLEDYLALTGLEQKVPGAGVIGRNFRMHINSALVVFSAFRDTDVMRKTAIFYNDQHPHSTVQCLGWLDGELLATQLPAATPEFFANVLGSRALGFFVTTEDGSSPDNRVIANRGGRPILDYEFDRIKPSYDEHEACIHDFERALFHAGYAGTSRWTGLAGTAHAVGTLVTGDDPATSVVDPHGKVRGLEGLYVSDGSVLPRTSRVNPALTIYAWGLRLGDRLAAMS
jgi:choline dehydrogenase-like flavoprotein